MNLLDEPKYMGAAKRVNDGFAAVNRAEVIPLLELCRELAQDAERYRWLRDNGRGELYILWDYQGEELDRVIDAEISREKGANA